MAVGMFIAELDGSAAHGATLASPPAPDDSGTVTLFSAACVIARHGVEKGKPVSLRPLPAKFRNFAFRQTARRRAAAAAPSATAPAADAPPGGGGGGAHRAAGGAQVSGVRRGARHRAVRAAQPGAPVRGDAVRGRPRAGPASRRALVKGK